MRKIIVLATLLALLGASLAVPAAAAAPAFPGIISVPTGFQPEGIAVGRGAEFFVGSLIDGAIYKGDLRSGQGDILVEGAAGKIAVGMSHDARSNLLFVAGGSTGKAYVYDAGSGALAGEFQLTAPGTFVNDVIVTRDAAYFTNSFLPEFYVLPLGPAGRLPGPGAAYTLALTGDWNQIPGFNANGIEARDGWLIIVNSAAGKLYRVNPADGLATEIDLGGTGVPSGDGLLLEGLTLYVVQNSFNKITAFQLNASLTEGTYANTITSDYFQIPTTAARFGSSLYAINAKFDVSPPQNPDPTLDFEVVKVRKN